MNFLISPQTEAENDKFLIDCFYEGDFIKDLIENEFSIIAGRKGSGKTALAKYIQQEHKKYNIFFSKRISIDEISCDESIDHCVEIIIFYIIVKTIKTLIDCSQDEILINAAKKYWHDFFIQNGLQEVDDYRSFVKWKEGRKAGFEYKGFGAESTSEYKKVDLSNSSTNLFASFKKSINPGFKVYFFIDDISDFLDRVNVANLKKQISIIRDLLLLLDKYNGAMKEEEKDFFFVACIREDLFEFMEGSNINKLESNCLKLKWREKEFGDLLIKRSDLDISEKEDYLDDSTKFLKKLFPDIIFSDFLNDFNTKRFHTNFYAYITAITFNRPRDFLKFCYILNKKISPKRGVEIKQVDAAEIEYSDYFLKELKDELHLSSQLLNFRADTGGINDLIKTLSQRDNFGISELKTEIGQLLSKKASNRIVKLFIENLWRYGIIGFRSNDRAELINFKYMDDSLYFSIDKEGVDDLTFFLHRGMYWAYKKKIK